MSYHVTIKTEIRDLEAVKALCREKGWTFHENKRTFSDPFNANQPCDHAINIGDCGYGTMWKDTELGLCKTPDGKAYLLKCDEMLMRAERLGKGGSHFMQLYGVHKATHEAKRLGYLVQRKALPTGAIQLIVTGNL
jgi:hypothetical protein